MEQSTKASGKTTNNMALVCASTLVETSTSGSGIAGSQKAAVRCCMLIAICLKAGGKMGCAMVRVYSTQGVPKRKAPGAVAKKLLVIPQRSTAPMKVEGQLLEFLDSTL